MIITVYLNPEPIQMTECRLCHLLCGHTKAFQSSLYAVSKEPNTEGKKIWRPLALRAGHGINLYIQENAHRDTINITREMDSVAWQKEYIMKIEQ